MGLSDGAGFQPSDSFGNRFLGRCPRLGWMWGVAPQKRIGPLARAEFTSSRTIGTARPSSAPTAHRHPSLGQRPRYRPANIMRAEGPFHLSTRMITNHPPRVSNHRAFPPAARFHPPQWAAPLALGTYWGARFLGRCPRLEWNGPLALRFRKSPRFERKIQSTLARIWGKDEG